MRKPGSGSTSIKCSDWAMNMRSTMPVHATGMATLAAKRRNSPGRSLYALKCATSPIAGAVLSSMTRIGALMARSAAHAT